MCHRIHSAIQLILHTGELNIMFFSEKYSFLLLCGLSIVKQRKRPKRDHYGELSQFICLEQPSESHQTIPYQQAQGGAATTGLKCGDREDRTVFTKPGSETRWAFTQQTARRLERVQSEYAGTRVEPADPKQKQAFWKFTESPWQVLRTTYCQVPYTETVWKVVPEILMLV